MEQIIIGDIMQGVSVLDVKEINSGNQTKVSLLEGPSSPYCTLWVTDLIILTPTRYLVTDQEGNIIMKRSLRNSGGTRKTRKHTK